MVVFILEIAASGERGEDVKKILLALTGPTSVLDGCISCRLSQDLEEPMVLRLREEWETERHLRTYLRSDAFRKVLAVMDLSEEPPGVRFQLPGGEKGLEYIAAVRGTMSFNDDLEAMEGDGQ